MSEKLNETELAPELGETDTPEDFGADVLETLPEGDTAEPFAMDRIDEVDTSEKLMELLGLSPEEKSAFVSITGDFSGSLENSSGKAKVYGNCVSTTCTYTMTYYSCARTK